MRLHLASVAAIGVGGVASYMLANKLITGSYMYDLESDPTQPIRPGFEKPRPKIGRPSAIAGMTIGFAVGATAGAVTFQSTRQATKGAEMLFRTGSGLLAGVGIGIVAAGVANWGIWDDATMYRE